MPSNDAARDVEGTPVDDFFVTMRRLLAGLGQSGQIISDPAVIAAEAAIGALCGFGGAGPVNETTLRLMPVNATDLERGLAVGMAMILALPELPWEP